MSESPKQKDLKFRCFERWARIELGEGYDKVDIKAEFDGDISLEENKTQFVAKYPHFPDIYAPDELDAMQEKINEKILAELDLRAKKEVSSKDLLIFYEPVYRAIHKLSKGYSLMVFIKGRAGIGKSWHIGRALREFDVEYRECHKVTEAFMPQLLYENRDKVIWFKDVVRMFNNPMMIAMIKACGEMTKDDQGKYLPRLITINNYSDDLRKAGVPREFYFGGGLIFDYNNVVSVRYLDDFQALTSRADYIELVFDFHELARIMRLIAKTEEEKTITETLIDDFKFFGQSFNLRTQQKAFDTFAFCREVGGDWREELKQELSMNESTIRSMLYQFIGKGAVPSNTLKKLLVQSGICGTLRTADRKINEWIEMEEIYKVSDSGYKYLISLIPNHNSVNNCDHCDTKRENAAN
jgi:hypothetical protein